MTTQKMVYLKTRINGVEKTQIDDVTRASNYWGSVFNILNQSLNKEDK